MQEDPEHIGIIPRAIVHIFDGKEADEDKDTIYFVHVSYVEIYNEEIRDLLSDNPTRKLDIKGNNGAIQGWLQLEFIAATVSVLPLKALLAQGHETRTWIDRGSWHNQSIVLLLLSFTPLVLKRGWCSLAFRSTLQGRICTRRLCSRKFTEKNHHPWWHDRPLLDLSDLTMHHVQTVGHCAELLRKGIANRVTSATTMNAHSSRSHAIFTVWLKIQTRDPSGSTQQTKAKLNLVDLAGSERHGKTGLYIFSLEIPRLPLASF